MALPTFSEFKSRSGNTGSSKLPSFSEFQKTSPVVKQKAEVVAQKADMRSRGEAVSVRDDRAAPTNVGSILRVITKPVATILARPGQALGAISGLSAEDQTIKSKYLGDIKTSQSGKDVVKDIGRAFETVSYGVGIGAVKNIGVNAGKQTAMQVAKRTAVEGVAGGFVGSAGNAIADGQSGKDLLWNTIKGTAIGGAAGFVLGGAGAKLLGGNKTAKVAQEADNAVKAKAFTGNVTSTVPESPTVARGTKPNPLNADKVNYEPYIPDSELPTIQMGSKPTSKLPFIQTGEKVALKAKGDFTYNPITGTKVSNTPITDVGTKGQKITPSQIEPVISSDKTLTPKGTVVPKVTVGEPVKITKEVVAKQSKALKALPDDEFNPQVKEASRNFYNEDPERAFRAIEGKEPLPEGVNKKALYALAKLDADGEKAIRLAELRAISSNTGQDLSMLNQGEGNGITDKIIELNDHFKKTLNKKEATKAISELAEEIKRNIPTKEELSALLDDITCKTYG